MNAMSVTSVGRSATPSILVAAVVSCVRPTSVRMSPRSILVFGRIGIVGGGRAARDLAQEDAARAGQLRQLGERLAVDRLVGHVDVDALHRHVQQLRVLDLGRVRPDHLHQHLARAGDRHHVALAAARCRRSASSIFPSRRMRWTKTRASGTSASASAARRPIGLAARLHAEGAHRPAVPGRAGAAHLLRAAALLLLVVLAGGRQVDAEAASGRARAITIAEPTVPNM